MKVKRFIVILLTICMIVTYTPAEVFAAEENGGSREEAVSEQTENSDMSETLDVDEIDLSNAEMLEEYSGEAYDTVELEDGTKVQTFYSYPVRFEDEKGEMTRIEPELVRSDSKMTENGISLDGYSFENKTSPYRTYIPDELSDDTPILMENDDYSFSMAPSSDLMRSSGEEVSVRDTTATFGTDKTDIKLEYISQNDGVKENIILNERPETNEFSFRLKFDNMTYRKNPTDSGITFYDKETGYIVMGIASPFMNDATGEAFSEDIEVDIQEVKDTGSSENEKRETVSELIMTLRVSEKYLDDPERVYPITIDPTATWTGSSQIHDAYIISSYPTTNFYSSSVVIMVSGRGSQGKNRTCINILNVKSLLLEDNISSATFDIYETGNGRSGSVVRVQRITESWQAGSVTWNTCPSFASTYVSQRTSAGTNHSKMSFNVKTWIEGIAGGGSNYGLILKNQVEASTSYTEFYGSRNSATSYRPKLTVVYTTDKPSTASTLTSPSPIFKGNPINVTWAGITANNLTQIQYKVAQCNSNWTETDSNYVAYTSFGTTASSGTKAIPNSANFPAGYYKIYLRGKSNQGIYGDAKTVNVQIVNDTPPTIGSLSLSKGGAAVPSDEYISKGTITAAVSNISDDKSLSGRTGSYTVKVNNTVVNSGSGISLTSSGTGYSANFSIPESSLSQSGTYTVTFSLTDSGGNPATKSASFKIDNEGPVIQASLEEPDNDFTYICFDASDELSGTDTITADLYEGTEANMGDHIEELSYTYNYGFVIEINNRDYANGEYTVKLTSADNVGNTSIEYLSFEIYNRVPAPTVSVRTQNSNTGLNVSWGYSVPPSDLDHLEYSINGGTWVSQPVTNVMRGEFNVDITGLTGTNYILLRGIDSNSIEGDETRTDFIVDSEAPTVSITGHERGILKGTITDNNLTGWKVYIKESTADDSGYELIKEGINAVDNGNICLIDFSNGNYTIGTAYIIKVEAEDSAGNITERTYSSTYTADYEGALFTEAGIKVLRKLGQSYVQDSFRVAVDSNSRVMFTTTDQDEQPVVSWYINNSYVDDQSVLTYTLNTSEMDTDNDILFTGIDSGSRFFSRDIYEDAVKETFSFSQPSSGIVEQNVVLDNEAVAVRFEFPDDAGVTYSVKQGTGSYQAVSDGDLVYITDLNSNIVKSNTVTLKAEASDSSILSALGSFSVLSSIYTNETFTAVTNETYWPEGFRVIDKINYKTYLNWDVPSVLPSFYYYEIHRSTIPEFEPNENTLVAETMDGYWCDINVNYGIPLYYKVRFIETDHRGHVENETSFTECKASAAIDQDEYLKHLGKKEYWGYAEVKTPNGSGFIEKYQGNFFFSMSDAQVSNEQMPVDITRSYNSDSTSKSSLGYGWTHNYDLELLRLGGDGNLDQGVLAFRDGQGTIYTFSRPDSETDVFVSSMGQYITLKEEDVTETYHIEAWGTNEEENAEVTSAYTMMTRDGIKFHFDASGKLVCAEEGNGNALLFRYDTERGLLSEVITKKGIRISYVYNSGISNDALTLNQVRLPDGSYVRYGYDLTGGLARLNEVRRYTSTGICIQYGYSYTDGKMATLTDGLGHQYSITYGEDNVRFDYPEISGNRESIKVILGEGITTTERLVNGSAVSKEEDTFDIYGQLDTHRTYSGSGNDFIKEKYVYENKLIKEERTESEYETYDPATGVISKNVRQISSSYSYDSQDKSTADITDTINNQSSETTYVYRGSNDNGTTEWNEYLPISISDGIYENENGNAILVETVSDEEFEYDEFGNLKSSKDYISDAMTEYVYGEDGLLESETESLMDSSGESAGTVSETEISTTYSSDGVKTEVVTTNSADKRTITENVYDVMGKLTSGTVISISDHGTQHQKGTKEETQYTYDGFGRAISETRTTSKLDSGLNVISGSSETTVTTKTYNPNGSLASEIDEKGVTTNYLYDDLNRVTSRTVNKGDLSQTTTTAYSYGPVSVNVGKDEPVSYTNCLITTESDNGVEIHKTYQDGLGRIVREINEGVITDYSYDLSGNRITEYVVTDSSMGAGILTYTLYNEEGTAYGTVIDPEWTDGHYTAGDDSVVTLSSFDEKGNIISKTDALANITEMEYDDQNRLTKVTLPSDANDPNETMFTYSESSNSSGDYTSTVTTTDALGRTSTEVMDANGNTVSITDNGSSGDTPITTAFEYDENGNVTRELHSGGDYISFEYNGRGKVTRRSEFNSSGTELTRTVYTYYPNDGELETVSDYTISGNTETLYHYEEYGYDGLNRLSWKAEINGSTVPNDLDPYKTTYSYDIHDNISSISYGSSIPTEIDSINYIYTGTRLTSVKANINNQEYTLKDYTYTDWGAVNTVKDYYDFKNSGISKYITLDYSYDRLMNVSQMVYTKDDDSVLESHGYVYDKAGKITEERNINSFTEVNEVRYFSYDELGRLTSSNIKDIEVTGNVSEEIDKLQTSYTFDKVGNRLTKTENGTTTNYVYNGLNQLVSETTGTDSLTYSYDANGNQTGITGMEGGISVSKSFTYTPGGMMASYMSGNDSQINTYTGNGVRIRKQEGTDISNYFYQEGSVLYTTDGSNNRKSFNLLNVSDIFGTERTENNADRYYFYLEDQRGSIVNLIDDSADQVASYWYNDFGEVGEEKPSAYSSFINEVQYTGAIYDSMTSLLYLNARFYDPSTGRFISQDTYRGEKNEPGTWHLYAYCANDSINYADTTGHDAIILKSNFVSKYIGHMAVLVQDRARTWRYFSWDNKGYRGKYHGAVVNIKYSVVKNKRVYYSINDRFDRTKNSTKYRQYLYVKGDFASSYDFVCDVKSGKSYRTYDLITINCAWMAIYTLQHGNISSKTKKKLDNLLWRTQYSQKEKAYGKYIRTVIPNSALKKLRNIFGGKIENVRNS